MYCYESECLASSRASLPRLSLSKILSLFQSPTHKRRLLVPLSLFWHLLSFFLLPMLVSLQDRTSDLTPFPESCLSESGGKKDCWSQPDPDRNCGFSQVLPRLCFADVCVVSCSEWVGQWASQASRMLPGCCRDAWLKVHPDGWKSVYGTRRIHEAGEQGASLLRSWMFFFPSSIQSDTSRLDRDQASDEKHLITQGVRASGPAVHIYNASTLHTIPAIPQT